MTEVPPTGDVVPQLSIAAHGAKPVRGIGNVPRSSSHTGKFGRLFRKLPPLQLTDEQVQSVANLMTDGADAATGAGGWSSAPSAADAGIAAGWTYFAQFVDHDITFDPTSLLGEGNDPDALENFRTPRFDLDCLYGLGPKANPWLYQRNDPDKLLLGQNPPEFSQLDLNRNHEGRALIGDPRNDVHVIIAQLHLAFVRFHNHVVDRLRAQPELVSNLPVTPVGGWGGSTPAPAGHPTFGQVVTVVRWHYQWLVLKHLLPAITGTDVLAEVLPEDDGRLVAKLRLYNVRRKPWIPVEFSAAAFRFGHSLVRSSYLLNGTGIPVLPIFSEAGNTDPLGDLRGERRLPASWQIEWHRFFDGLPGSGPDTIQRARLFDTRVVTPLHALPVFVDGQRRSLALLNLKRAAALELPSGDDFASAVAESLGWDVASVQIPHGLGHAAPLWFWILKEAELTRAGQTLGKVGGRVVAEVLIGLAQNDPSSFLRAQPTWQPFLGPVPGEFTMADLLTLAQS